LIDMRIKPFFNKGFSLIELMIVIAIMAALVAIALPTYLNYLSATKKTSAKSNCTEAQRFISSELAKRAVSQAGVTTDAIADLNRGGRRSPYSGKDNIPAFSDTLGRGVVRLSKTNLQALSAGDNVTIECEWSGDDVADSIYSLTVE
jgi:prepilin-type N-terminal cleavage/methylation domain-containing protein